MSRHEVRSYKSILNRHKFIDSWFWGRYGVNPYVGCEFGCTYCDTRSGKYHLHEDFEETIFVKADAAEMLDQRLTRARKLLPDVVCMSGGIDPYQPAEARFGSTRACLEVLAAHDYPVHLLTKSTLVTRDADLLARIARASWATVSVTVTTTDPDLARFLEPNAPPPNARFDTVTALNAAGIPAGVNLIPVVPVLGDAPEQIAAVVECAARAGARYVLFGGGMTLRDRQASYFLERLARFRPEAVAPLLALYDATWTPGETYQGSYAPKATYLRRQSRHFFDVARTCSMPWRIRRFIPEDFRADNYRIAQRFLDEAYEHQCLGRAWSNLHWAGQNIQNLGESLRDLAARNALTSVRNVTPELASRIEELLHPLAPSP